MPVILPLDVRLPEELELERLREERKLAQWSAEYRQSLMKDAYQDWERLNLYTIEQRQAERTQEEQNIEWRDRQKVVFDQQERMLRLGRDKDEAKEEDFAKKWHMAIAGTPIQEFITTRNLGPVSNKEEASLYTAAWKANEAFADEEKQGQYAAEMTKILPGRVKELASRYKLEDADEYVDWIVEPLLRPEPEPAEALKNYQALKSDLLKAKAQEQLGRDKATVDHTEEMREEERAAWQTAVVEGRKKYSGIEKDLLKDWTAEQIRKKEMEEIVGTFKLLMMAPAMEVGAMEREEALREEAQPLPEAQKGTLRKLTEVGEEGFVRMLGLRPWFPKTPEQAAGEPVPGEKAQVPAGKPITPEEIVAQLQALRFSLEDAKKVAAAAAGQGSPEDVQKVRAFLTQVGIALPPLRLGEGSPSLTEAESP